jgi:hypothetical protein
MPVVVVVMAATFCVFMAVVMVVGVIVAAGGSLSVVMPAVLRHGPHLPVEQTHHAQKQAANQHLDAESAFADQVLIDPATGVKPDQHHRPKEQHHHFQKEQEPPGPLLPADGFRARSEGMTGFCLMGMGMVVIMIMATTAWTVDVPGGGRGWFMIMNMIVIVIRGGGRRGAHDFNQVMDFSQGHSASMPKPAA